MCFGLGAGLLIYLIRTWGSYPDGTAFAILLMNLMAPSLERLAQQRQQATR
ncbi:electron transport complex protein RnfD [compost metagenome]